jgi:hypothetical protein
MDLDDETSEGRLELELSINTHRHELEFKDSLARNMIKMSIWNY